MEGFTYLGTIDDMVVKYPWRFRVTEKTLNHSLVIQLLDGNPILLNDGYLVLHPLGREALLDRDSLLWELIKAGFVRVMARGGTRYGLAEMPLRMAKEGIRSYQWIVDDQVPDVSWKELRASLEVLDAMLRKSDHLMSWPAYEAGTGFRVLAETMCEKDSSARTLGLAKHVHPGVIPGFLKAFIERMYEDPRKPRSRWEALVRLYANDAGNTNRPKEFVRSMMNLANEMYHYNMGVMLAAGHDVPVAVETQTSAAFDDLLVTRNTILEEPEVFRLNVPRALTSVDPLRLAKVLEPGSKVFTAREQWLRARRVAEFSAESLTQSQRQALRETARDYASQLSKLFGSRVRYDETEGLFGYAVGMVVKNNVTAPLVAAGTVAAATIGPVGPLIAGAAAFATGFIVHRGQKALLGGITKKFKISLLKEQLVPPALIERSARIIRRIKERRAPSSIEIARPMAQALVAKMTRFSPPSA